MGQGLSPATPAAMASRRALKVLEGNTCSLLLVDPPRSETDDLPLQGEWCITFLLMDLFGRQTPTRLSHPGHLAATGALEFSPKHSKRSQLLHTLNMILQKRTERKAWRSSSSTAFAGSFYQLLRRGASSSSGNVGLAGVFLCRLSQQMDGMG